MKIGTAAEARQALKIHQTGVFPPGWSMLGSGSTRMVYLSPSKVAYKVAYRSEEDNIEEHLSSKRLRNKKFSLNVKVPHTYLYLKGEVLAMEYIKPAHTFECATYHTHECGKLLCLSKYGKVVNHEMKIGDFYSFNAIIDEHKDVWAIDMGWSVY